MLPYITRDNAIKIAKQFGGSGSGAGAEIIGPLNCRIETEEGIEFILPEENWPDMNAIAEKVHSGQPVSLWFVAELTEGENHVKTQAILPYTGDMDMTEGTGHSKYFMFGSHEDMAMAQYSEYLSGDGRLEKEFYITLPIPR